MGTLHLEPLARARVAPRVRSCNRRIQMLWLVPAGAHGTALGARTAWGPHLLSPPACVVPQGVPRGRAHREVTRASWCGPPLLQLTPPCTGGGGLFAHKFASFPRTTRPATHPPFPRRFPGRASTEPLCTRVAADACECRLCLGPRGPVSGSGRLWPEPNGSGRRGSAATGSGASL